MTLQNCYAQTFPATNDTTKTGDSVALIGSVKLLDISKQGDSTYAKDFSKVQIEVTIINENGKKIKKVFFPNNFGKIKLICEYNYLFNVEFICKKYQTKFFVVNTEKKPEWENDFKYGFDFPFEITLIRKHKNKDRKSLQVAVIKYNHTTGYFDYK